MKDALWQALSSLSLFVLLAIPGWLFSRKKWISSLQIDGLSTVLVQFIWPVMVIDAMLQPSVSPQALLRCGTVALYTVLGIALAAVLAVLMLRWSRTSLVPGGILVFALMFSNTGLIGMPLMQSLLGDEALFLTTIAELVNDILIFSVGLVLMQRSCGTREPLRLSALLSPGFLGMLLGLFFFLTGIKPPALLAQALHLIAGATTPITMFVVGAQVGEQPIRQLLGQKRLYAPLLLKLLGIPALVYGILFFLLGQRDLIAQVIVLLFAMPSGTCCALFARQYHGDHQLATGCVTLTTLCSALTLPLWMVLCSLK